MELPRNPGPVWPPTLTLRPQSHRPVDTAGTNWCDLHLPLQAVTRDARYLVLHCSSRLAVRKFDMMDA